MKGLKRRRWLRTGIAVSALIGGIFLWWRASKWPGEGGDPITRAGAIVILGGDTSERGALGMQLYRKKVAPWMVVSGDSGEIVAFLKDAGADPAAILHEDKSRSTWENAVHVKPMLEELGARDVVLVTSWYHAGRARAVFETMMPDVRFSVACGAMPQRLDEDERRVLKRERFAYGAYWLKDRIHFFR